VTLLRDSQRLERKDKGKKEGIEKIQGLGTPLALVKNKKKKIEKKEKTNEMKLSQQHSRRLRGRED